MLRMGKSKAGPVVSDNGNMIIDVDFGIIENPAELNQILKMLPGVVETGLFIDMAVKAFFGQADGECHFPNKMNHPYFFLKGRIMWSFSISLERETCF